MILNKYSYLLVSTLLLYGELCERLWDAEQHRALSSVLAVIASREIEQLSALRGERRGVSVSEFDNTQTPAPSTPSLYPD